MSCLKSFSLKLSVLVIAGRLILDNMVVKNPLLGIYPQKGFISWMLVLVSFFFLDYVLKKRTDMNEGVFTVTVTMLYAIAFLPFTSAVGRGWFSDDLLLLLTAYWLVFWGIACYFAGKSLGNKMQFLDSLYGNEKAILFISAMVVFIACYINIKYAGGRILWNISYSDIYVYRLNAREWQLGAVIQGIFDWGKVVVPFMLSLCLYRGRYLGASIFLITLLIIFSCNCDKMPVLTSAIMSIMMIVLRNFDYSKLHLLILGGEVFVGVGTFAFPGLRVWDLITRRLMFLPNELHTLFYDFFLSHEFDFFRSGFLRHFGFGGPYPQGVPRAIGMTYFNPNNAANNGLFSDAFSNLGYIGILVMPIVVVLFLKTCDLFAKGLEWQLKFVAAGILSLAIISGSFVTMFILQGSVIMLLLLFTPRHGIMVSST